MQHDLNRLTEGQLFGGASAQRENNARSSACVAQRIMMFKRNPEVVANGGKPPVVRAQTSLCEAHGAKPLNARPGKVPFTAGGAQHTAFKGRIVCHPCREGINDRHQAWPHGSERRCVLQIFPTKAVYVGKCRAPLRWANQCFGFPCNLIMHHAYRTQSADGTRVRLGKFKIERDEGVRQVHPARLPGNTSSARPVGDIL